MKTYSEEIRSPVSDTDLLEFDGADFAVDLNGFLAKHEIIYQDSSASHSNGLLIGNGDLMCAAYTPQGLEWGLNKTDVWDQRWDRTGHALTSHARVLELLAEGRRDEVMRLFQIEQIPFRDLPYPHPKSCGIVRVRLEGLDLRYPRPGEIEQRQRLRDGVVETSVRTDLLSLNVQSWVDANSNRMVIDLRLDSPARASAEVELHRWRDEVLPDASLQAADRMLALSHRFPDGLAYGVSARLPEVECETRAGQFEATAGFVLQAGVPVRIVVGVATSLESDDPDALAARLASEVDESTCSAHRDWWRDFWSHSFVSFGDQFLENLYYLHLYLLAVQSRGRQPAPLYVCEMFDYSSYHSAFLSDINIEQIYWPVFASNHIELGRPFFEWVKRCLPNIIEETRRVFGMRGMKFPWATFPHGWEMSDTWGRYIHCSTGWVAEIFWWGWLYGRDIEFLRNTAYPVIREAATFYEDYLTRDDEGRFNIYPSVSPEQGEWWTTNPTIDLSVIKVTMRAALESSEILGIDESRRPRWRDILENLSDYPNDGSVLLDHEGAAPDSPLGHPALLNPVFSAGDIGIHSPADRITLARRTLDGVLERSKRKVPTVPFGVPTWADDITYGWLACVAARLDLPEMCRAMIYDMGIFQFLRPNGAFALDGANVMPQRARQCLPSNQNSNSSLLSAVVEMLLQSYDGIIEVFRGLWEMDAAFAHLRAVGGFLVSAERKEGEVQYIGIHSTVGGTCTVRNRWSSLSVEIRTSDGNPVEHQDDGSCLHFDTVAGQTYRISPVGRSSVRRRISGERRVGPRWYVGPLYLAKEDIGDGLPTYLGLPYHDPVVHQLGSEQSIVRIDFDTFSRGHAVYRDHWRGLAPQHIDWRSATNSFVEYLVEVDLEGDYYFDICYAAERPRPCVLSIDGQSKATPVTARISDSWNAEDAIVDPTAVLRLSAGRHLIRLERRGFLPNIQWLSLERAV